MSDRLYQGARLDGDSANPETIADTVVQTIQALEGNAESRPFPLALDWSSIQIAIGPDATLPGNLKVNVSAPVL